MMMTESVSGFLWFRSDIGRHPVTSSCGFRLRRSLAASACEYVPVNTHPANTQVFSPSLPAGGGEEEGYVPEIELSLAMRSRSSSTRWVESFQQT